MIVLGISLESFEFGKKVPQVGEVSCGPLVAFRRRGHDA
jgi:hypothetical protein